MQQIQNEQLQNVLDEHDRSTLKLEARKEELMVREKELRQRKALNESEKRKLDEQKDMVFGHVHSYILLFLYSLDHFLYLVDCDLVSTLSHFLTGSTDCKLRTLCLLFALIFFSCSLPCTISFQTSKVMYTVTFRCF